MDHVDRGSDLQKSLNHFPLLRADLPPRPFELKIKGSPVRNDGAIREPVLTVDSELPRFEA